MEKEIFDRIEEGIGLMISKGIERIYLFPFGQRATELYEVIKLRYPLEFVRVDNVLSSKNPQIISWEKAIGRAEKEENSGLLITSDNPAMYNEIRLTCAKWPGFIFDIFPKNPWDFHKSNRVSAAAVIAEDIYRRGRNGNIAEAGVYRGEFAKYLNALFPDRKLYLFDTFEGFRVGQVKDNKDCREEVDVWIDALKNTDEELVMGKMRYPDKVDIRKGFFPETAKDIEDRFVFVSLDMDLYEPTIMGLEFFWERLVPGGVIFVHDFGNYEGIDKAVIEFCSGHSLGYVSLNDFLSVCIVKPL